MGSSRRSWRFVGFRGTATHWPRLAVQIKPSVPQLLKPRWRSWTCWSHLTFERLLIVWTCFIVFQNQRPILIPAKTVDRQSEKFCRKLFINSITHNNVDCGTTLTANVSLCQKLDHINHQVLLWVAGEIERFTFRMITTHCHAVRKVNDESHENLWSPMPIKTGTNMLSLKTMAPCFLQDQVEHMHEKCVMTNWIPLKYEKELFPTCRFHIWNEGTFFRRCGSSLTCPASAKRWPNSWSKILVRQSMWLRCPTFHKAQRLTCCQGRPKRSQQPLVGFLWLLLEDLKPPLWSPRRGTHRAPHSQRSRHWQRQCSWSYSCPCLSCCFQNLCPSCRRGSSMRCMFLPYLPFDLPLPFWKA